MITASGLIQLGFEPLVDFVVTKDNRGTHVEWLSDQPQPTEAEIEAADAEYNAQWSANQYQRDRAVAYPSIADQLDQIYHEGIDAWKETIAAVKAEYPKP
jgi:hypothetical protein